MQNLLFGSFRKTDLLVVFVGAFIILSIPSTSSAAVASFEKYYRTNSHTVFPQCSPGWNAIDNWGVYEGDKSDGGGGWHTGTVCSSSSYSAAISKYFRSGADSRGNLDCPSGWTQVDSWTVYEGDSADGGGGDHLGKACVLNGGATLAAFTKYYRLNDSLLWLIPDAGRGSCTDGSPWILGKGNNASFVQCQSTPTCPPGYVKESEVFPDGSYQCLPNTCPSGWSMIDIWAVQEGDRNDGGGGWHGGVVCSSDTYEAASAKQWREQVPSNAVGNFGCPSGWNQVDWWTVNEGDSADGGGGLHDGKACALPKQTGTIQINATNNGQPLNNFSFTGNWSFNGVSQGSASFSPPQSIPGSPAGTYTITSVTPPAGMTFQGVNGSPLPYSMTLGAGGAITATFNFVPTPPSTGTIIVNTIKDGKPWDSPALTVNYTGPGGAANAAIDTDTSGQQTIPGAPVGTFTINSVCSSCLPTGIVLYSVVPQSQNLAKDGTITFTLNFSTTITPPQPVPTLAVSPSYASVQIGGTQPFNAIYDPDGSGPQAPQIVTYSAGWSSSNVLVASVDSVGTATGVAAGSATITASYSGLTASASLTVLAPTPTLTVDPYSASVAMGNTQQFKATYDPDGSGPQPSQDVTATAAWSPSDSSKVTVSGGLAKRVGYGTVAITASYAGMSASAYVIDPAQISVIPSSKSLQFSETVQLLACLNPNGTASADCSGASEQNVTNSSNWISSNTRATVDNVSSKGLVTASPTQTGYATIRASYSGLIGSASIRVSAPPAAPLTVSCSASPTETTTGLPVVWTATVSGGTSPYTYNWIGSTPLNGKSGNPVTVTYTTTTPNPKVGSVRITSGDGQVVTQACTTSVTVGNPPPPPIATLLVNGATSATIDNGQPAKLTWTSTNGATRCDSSDFNTNGLSSNTDPGVSVSPSADTTYSIYCTNSGGAGPTASVSVTVASPKVSISAKPSCVSGGGSTKITWSATQVKSCNVSGPGLSSSQTSDSQTVNVTSKSKYSISCDTQGGSTIDKSVTVDVAGCWSEF